MPRFPDDAVVLERGCDRCPDLVDSRTRISWGNGSRDAQLLIVGEAPGAGNPDANQWKGGNWTGMAYTSRHSGRRIRRLIERLGYAEDAFFTNAVKCFPAVEATESSGNREPSAAERTNCSTHLRTEVDIVDPTVVVSTGKHATVSILEMDGRELDGFLETVLEPSRCRELDVWLLPILHPSYQDIWVSRLGFEPEEYIAAIGETLDALLSR